jgi:putative endonuclease
MLPQEKNAWHKQGRLTRRFLQMPHERQNYGMDGENMAAGFLVAQGYQIVICNYKNRYGEIDIIAMDGETLVFVEVKSRRSDRFGSARESVSRAKQKKISMVALGYLKSTGSVRRKARFDVVAVNSNASAPVNRIELIKNAFDLCYG